MTDEILKGELLTDEQLEQIAGGNIVEIMYDIFAMNEARKDIGDFKFTGNPFKGTMEGNCDSIRRMWAKLGVATVYYDGGTIPNEYYMNGKQISRADAIKYLFTESGKPDSEYIKIYSKS